MKLTFPLLNTTLNVPVDDAMAGGKKSRRELRRKKIEGKVTEQVEKTPEANSANDKPVDKSINEPAETISPSQQTEPTPSKGSSLPLLMVEVENVTHEKFRQTEEIKVPKILINKRPSLPNRINKEKIMKNHIYLILSIKKNTQFLRAEVTY